MKFVKWEKEILADKNSRQFSLRNLVKAVIIDNRICQNLVIGERSLDMSNKKQYDIFISHASEDKEALARPLARALFDKGYSVFLDELVIKMGDSISESINFGLSQSDYGLIIISPIFLSKNWTKAELNSITNMIISSGKKVLPVWHEVTYNDVLRSIPLLADRKAALSSDGIDSIIAQIQESIGSPAHGRPSLTNYMWSFYDFLPEMQISILESINSICNSACCLSETSVEDSIYSEAELFLKSIDTSKLEEHVIEPLEKARAVIDRELSHIMTEIELESSSF